MHLRRIYDFITGHHGTPIVPACFYHLRYVNDEEQHVTDGQDEVLHTSCWIAAQQPCQPSKLHVAPDGKAGQKGTKPITLIAEYEICCAALYLPWEGICFRKPKSKSVT